MPPKPPPPLDVRVTIQPNGSGGYSATVDQDKPTVKPARAINWFFDAPDDFPSGSVLYIRFFKKNLIFQKVDDRGCMQGSQWKDGIGEAEPDGRKIFGKVRNLAQGGFTYEIKYRLLAGGDHLLLDPEIIVEGSPEPTPDDKPKDRKKSAKRSARKTGKAKKSKKAKKAKKAKPAKRATRAKKAKKAKRSTKRKAKKR